tara:strand:+ start:312 stop:1064 length:753 start_codon:yes stop_codon:yes gene_type:complete
MAVFTSFQDILPDPNNQIGDAGHATGTAGPGFASVNLSSDNKVSKNLTNSGRLIARAIAYHSWKINIKYNPMTRAQFEPVYNFLVHRRGSIKPFYISLPQYKLPQDSNFSSYINTNSYLEATANGAAGATSITLARTGYNPSGHGYPKPGDMFTITSTLSSNHTKAYRVTRVETNSDWYDSDGVNTSATQPGTAQARIHFTPGLQKATASADDFVFKSPLIKVILSSDVQQYSLNVNNLYQFGLSLEEVQ